MILSLAKLIIGIVLMMLGIFRFTIYKERFNRPLKVAGFAIDPDVISVALFIIGMVLVLLFFVNYLQPMFYKGRDMHPGITYVLSLASYT